jgi:predicted alpha/beta-fold hydrolase
LNTIVPALFRRSILDYKRERIETPDHDFLDLDFSSIGSSTAVVILHGLEGSTTNASLKGLAKAINKQGWDAIGFNQRSCSGEANRLETFYHFGKSDDLNLVINHINNTCNYENILLVGYSLGGNIVLKYMGETQWDKTNVTAGAAISVPCALGDSAYRVGKWYNKVYMVSFLKTLKQKVLDKCLEHPQMSIDKKQLVKAKNFEDFDNAYTAPIHGFKNANHYWDQSSSKPFLPTITLPTLLINAQDDPFLTPSCFPYKEAEESAFLHLETPKKGGHVGFVSTTGINGVYWHETRIIKFLAEQLTAIKSK